ncbi:uncharacterized protein F4807DRAFT_302793 [Annulohypoxylon truncatum]|uniref:uncharacterized protein n=1 Tax=Annulohypoxylon truncatum TaxID=327061 RepID=UPI0020087FD9|nr:uncharacterized protein F4807DRAFT_302793 [Annulohypoxylon truncatum]KAI1212872.1 hypothetical protein F4807DRAFT_302793 [Annulohypoxylon truncatum]
MHFNCGMPFNHSHDSPNSQIWNPDSVLGLTNKNINNYSCLGWAKTRGRRCERWIAQHKTSYGHNILHKLACDSPSKAAESPRLHDAADILLCWQHAGQISDILGQWKRKLEKCADDIESENKSHVKAEAFEDGWLKQLQEDLARGYAAGKTVPPRNIKREEEERRAQEKKQREQEKRRQEEKERQRKEEERKREQKAREEASRQRAQRAKKREREAREKAEKEAASWRTAWERYCNAWSKPADVSVTNIPWPVKSGLQSDVNEANVKLFFAKAPPADSVDSGDKRFKLISEENMRWHTDKMMQRFGPDVVNGAAKGPLGIIAKVVIELRQEARRGRGRQGR